MIEPEFDRHARTYREAHEANISLTGETPEYFAAYKMRDFADMVAAVGANPDGNYLDFGSGIGASVRPFLKCLPNASLVCADVSNVSLTQSRQLHGDAVTYLPIEHGKLATKSASMDGAFACCVFHHIPVEEQPQALSELHRVLKPGAPLMVYEHNPFNPLTVRAVNTCPFDENAVLIRARDMQRLCLAAGFTSAHVRYRVFFPAALRALRPFEKGLGWLALGAQYAVHARA